MPPTHPPFTHPPPVVLLERAARRAPACAHQPELVWGSHTATTADVSQRDEWRGGTTPHRRRAPRSCLFVRTPRRTPPPNEHNQLGASARQSARVVPFWKKKRRRDRFLFPHIPRVITILRKGRSVLLAAPPVACLLAATPVACLPFPYVCVGIPYIDVKCGLRGRFARAAGPPGRRAGDCDSPPLEFLLRKV